MKIKGLKKAVGEYTRANVGGAYDPQYGIMYYNTRTGEIWTTEYYDIGHGSYTAYDDPDVINLSRAMRERDPYGKITMATVKAFVAANYKRVDR